MPTLLLIHGGLAGHRRPAAPPAAIRRGTARGPRRRRARSSRRIWSRSSHP